MRQRCRELDPSYLKKKKIKEKKFKYVILVIKDEFYEIKLTTGKFYAFDSKKHKTSLKKENIINLKFMHLISHSFCYTREACLIVLFNVDIMFYQSNLQAMFVTSFLICLSV